MVTPVHKNALDTYKRSSLLVIAAEKYDLIKDDIANLQAKHNDSILPIVLILKFPPENLIELAQQDIFVFPNENSIWQTIHWISQPIIDKGQSPEAIKNGRYDDKKLEHIAALTARAGKKMKFARKTPDKKKIRIVHLSIIEGPF